jgi:tetratricopeptide (TPR) repeat protein
MLEKETLVRARRGRRSLGLALAGLGMLCAAALPAQERMGRGRVSGSVRDEQGTPLESVLVVAESADGTTKLDGQTDNKGRFVIGGLGTGMWRFTASKPGFASASREAEVRQLRANESIDLALRSETRGATLAAQGTASDLFAKGVALFGEQRYDDALTAFGELSAKNPDVYQVHMNIALCYREKGDLAQAEAALTRVLDKIVERYGALSEQTTIAASALTELAQLALRRNDLTSALGHFRRLLELSPQDATAAYNIGEVLFVNGKLDEALKHFELAERLQPDWARPTLKIGIVSLSQNRLPRALECFKKVAGRVPNSPEGAQARECIAAIEGLEKR